MDDVDEQFDLQVFSGKESENFGKEITTESITALLNLPADSNWDEKNTIYVLLSRRELNAPSLSAADAQNLILSLDYGFKEWSIASAAGETLCDIGASGDKALSYLLAPGIFLQTVDEVFLASSISLDRFLIKIKVQDIHDIFGTIFSAKDLKKAINRFVDRKSGAWLIVPQLAAWGDFRNRASLKITKSQTQLKDELAWITKAPSLAVITRTRWQRPKLLSRNIDSVSKAIANSRQGIEVRHVIVSDLHPPSEVEQLEADIAYVPIDDPGDSRFRLINWAVHNLEEEFFWFLDDDDYLDENAIHEIEYALSCRLSRGLIFVDSQQQIVFEGGIFDGKIFSGHKYRAAKYEASYSENNFTPICSVIFPKDLIQDIPEGALDRITLLEDHLLLILALAKTNKVPLCVSKTLAYISVKKKGGADVLLNQKAWNEARSELVRQWSVNERMLSLGFLANARAASKLSFKNYFHMFQKLLSLSFWMTLLGNSIIGLNGRKKLSWSSIKAGIRKI